jgi:GntR family transcriptional regulator
VKRLRLADAEPLAIEIAHLPAGLCPGLERQDLEANSLYELLGREFDIIPARAEQQIEALACPASEARLLGVRKGSPMLHMYRVTYGRDGQAIEHTESFYRGDRYIFHVELAGNGAQAPEVGRKS